MMKQLSNKTGLNLLHLLAKGKSKRDQNILSNAAGQNGSFGRAVSFYSSGTITNKYTGETLFTLRGVDSEQNNCTAVLDRVELEAFMQGCQRTLDSVKEK